MALNDLFTVAKMGEDYALRPVPADERRGYWSIQSVWIGWVLVTTVLWAGGSMGKGLTLAHVLTASVVGCGVLAAVSILTAIQGQRTGLTYGLLTRKVFGVRGTWLPGLIMGVGAAGWFSVNVNMGGQLTVPFIMDPAAAPAWLQPMLVIISGLLFGATMIFGIRILSLLAQLAVPLLVVISAVTTIWAVADKGGFGALAAIQPTEPMPWAVAVTAIVGTFVAGAIIMPDVMRYARTGSHAGWAGFITMFVGYQYMLLVGALLVLAVGQPDVAVVLQNAGFGWLGWITMYLLLWTSAGITGYSASLALSAVTGIEKTKISIAILIFGIVVSLIGVLDWFVPFLIFLGIFVSPIAGAFIADFWFKHRGRYANLESILPGAAVSGAAAINWAAIAGWAVGSAVAYYTSKVVPWGVPPLQGIIAALIVALVVGQLYRPGVKVDPGKSPQVGV